MANTGRELDSTAIRHLILATKLSGGQIGDIARNVAYAAVRQGLLTEVPDFAYETPLADKITAVVWQLILEGVYTRAPGCSNQTCHISE